MKRMLTALVGAALLVGLTVTPVGAGKGAKSIETLNGTYSGTSVGDWSGCAWDPQRLAIYADGNHFGGWAYYGPQSSGTAGVRAGNLKGTMSWRDVYWTGPGPWTFLSADGRSNLWGHADLREPGPNFGMLVTVTGGNGKFAAVTGGQFTLLTSSVVAGGVCAGLDPASLPYSVTQTATPPLPSAWNPALSWPARANGSWLLSADASGSLVGYLIYG